MDRSTPTPWGLLAATGFALGAALPLGKLAGQHGIGPVSFVLVPVLVAGLLLTALAAWRHGRPPAGFGRLAVFGLVTGLLGNAVPNTLTAWLALEAGASFSAVAYTLPPVFTLLFALAVGLERARWMRLLAVAMALAGALWLAFARVAGGDLSWQGAAVLIAIPTAIGAGNIYRALYLPARVPAEWLGAALSLGAFSLLVPVWWLGPSSWTALAGTGLPYLALQSVAAAAGAVLFFQLQRRADPVAMSFVGYAIAITGVLLGAALLGEHLPWQLLPAAVLIVSGFWLLQSRRPALPAPRPVSPQP